MRVLSYQISDAKVHGQRNDGGHQASPEGARKVCDIADKPDSKEDEGDAVSRAGLVVLDQLGHLVVVLAIGRVRPA